MRISSPTLWILVGSAVACNTPVDTSPTSFDHLLPGEHTLVAIDGQPATGVVTVVSDGFCGFTDSLGVDHSGSFTVQSGPGGSVSFEEPATFRMEETLTFRCQAPGATNVETFNAVILGTFELVQTRLFIRDIDNSLHPNRFFGGDIYPDVTGSALDSIVVVIDRGQGLSFLNFK